MSDTEAKAEDGIVESKVTLSDRLIHFSWSWYVVTMSTGGIATLLGNQEHSFHGLRTIGKIVFIWNLLLFIVITSLLTSRFIRRPSLFIRSLRNPSEGLFVPTGMLSIVTIIICMQLYGVPASGPWLALAVRILFWIYVPLAFLLAVFQYGYLFTAKRLTIHDMMPNWLLPIFPIMLTGTLAGAVASTQPTGQAMSILVAGLTFQGLGFWSAISMYAVLIARLMEFGLPHPNLRPALFIAVGPPSFTCLAFINMSKAIPREQFYFQRHPSAAEALVQIGLAFGIFLWGLAFWFFCIALLSVMKGLPELRFHLVWYAMIFPNVGFTVATITIGKGLYSSAIEWVGSAMTIVMVAVYLIVVAFHVHAVVTKQILWPGKDEDRDT